MRTKGRRRYIVAAVAVIALLAGVAGGVAAIRGTFDSGKAPDKSARSPSEGYREPTEAAPPTSSADSTFEAPAMIEVPNVVGKPLGQARMVLSYARLGVVTYVPEGAKAGPDDVVVSQQPGAGTKVAAGTDVTLNVAIKPKTQPKTRAVHFVVAIDPGHQARADLSREPIGPGSSETKEKVRGGATGVVTRVPEYKLVLDMSLKLKTILEDAGIEVVMVRMGHNVNISNAQRAEIANKAGADLAIRVHADSSPNQATAGVSTLYPASNTWTKPISGRSKQAAEAVQKAVLAATGAKDRGIVARGDITGFNWSKVPTIIVETGFLSNPAEDRLLNTPTYQDKLASGMSRGILAFLGQ